MNLFQQAILDTQLMTSDPGGWGTSIAFTAPGGDTAEVNGLATTHHLGMTDEGKGVNTKTASISVSEALLIAENYPIRNNSGEVSLIGHKVRYKDSNSVEKTYVISQAFPDETIGLITCELRDFE